MKALVKKEAARGLWMQDVPVPKISENEVLIKIKKSSICGTDVHIYKWDAWAQKNVPVSTTIGHEFVGIISEVGKNVKGLKIGDRVSGEGHIVCGTCINCRKGLKHLCPNTVGVGVKRNGSFAEYLSLPAENVFQVPAEIEDDIAAIFDPYGNAVHTALSFSLTGEDVLITGAGPIGMMAAAIAKQAGARNVVITDINQYRLDLAKKLGAKTTVNISTTSLTEVMNSLNIKEGFTVGLEMSGSPAGLNNMLVHSQPGAKLALLGILPPKTEIDWDLVIFKMLNIKGIYGREIFTTWYQMVHLIEGGLNLKPLITHHYGIDDFEKGFEAMLSGNCGKVILNWD
jgi:threonine 3-dehydrogenase